MQNDFIPVSNVFFREINFKKNFFVKLIFTDAVLQQKYTYLNYYVAFFHEIAARVIKLGVYLLAAELGIYISFLTLKSVHSNYYYSLKKKMKTVRRRSLYIIMPRNNRWCERGLLDSLIFESEAK